MLFPPTRSIQTLLPGLPLISKIGPDNVEITQITHNSNEVIPGSLFVAIKGFNVDGHTFIPEALHRGAACVVLEDPSWIPSHPTTLFLHVSNSRKALALLAANYYHSPSQHLTLIGVTGTNGKTTTAYLIESILERASVPTGVIGTVNYRYGDRIIEARTTTPDPILLQKTLSEMVKANIQATVMEVSSHALALHRVDGCHFDIGVWTNLSQDHLDFHGDMETYFHAKERLFTHLLSNSQKPQKKAILNLDDAYGKRLVRKLSSLPLFTYGTSPKADIHPVQTDLHAEGIKLTVQTPTGTFPIASNLIGHHNLINLLAAIAVGISLNVPKHAIVDGLRNIIVPGRLQSIPNKLGITVLIDYAHTPDALKNVLESLRPLTKRQIITVFGCGGDRDKDKRPVMGAVAERYSDRVILTHDNPRTEDPLSILNQIESGIRSLPRVPKEAFLKADKGYLTIPDRKKAIQLAILAASPGDIVLIAGKGHETYQIIGSNKTPFSDMAVAKAAIDERSGRKE